MRATNVGVNMDLTQKRGSGVKLLSQVRLKDYVDAKYDGLPQELRRVILHPYYQTAMQQGVHNV